MSSTNDDLNFPPHPLEAWARRTVSKLFRSWVFVIFVSLLFAVAAGIWVLHSARTNTPAIYLYGIQFNFEGQFKNQYPDGSDFSLSDITEAAQLTDVYERNNLSNYNISLTDFIKSVSVRPFNTGKFATIREFELMSRKWVNSLSDLQNIKEEMETEMRRAGASSALISLVDSERLIPNQIARKALVEIAEIWSKTAVNNRGVLNIQIDSVKPQVMDANIIEQNSKLNALTIIRRRIGSLKDFLQKLGEQPGGKSISDEETGLNIAGLDQRLSDIELGLLEVPRSWSADSNNISSDTKLPVNIFSPAIFSPTLIENKDQLVAIEIVSDRIEIMRNDIQKISSTTAGGLVTDFQTGVTLFDLDRQLLDIQRIDLEQLRAPIVSLGISKNPAKVKLLYEARIEQLNRDLQSTRREAEVIKSALEEGELALGNVVRSNQDTSTDGGNRSPIGITQLGDGVIDRILSLSEKSGSNEFLKELINRRTSTRLREVDITSEISRLRGFIAKVESRQGLNSENQISEQSTLAKEITAEIEEKLPAIIETLRGYSQTLHRISARLGYANQVHQSLFADVDAPLYSINDYLLDNHQAPMSLSTILSDLKNYTEVANRLLDRIGVNKSGASQDLYLPITSAEPVPQEMINMRTVMLVVMMGAAGFLLAILAIMFIPMSKREKH